jgi:acetyl esterase/lipase
VKFDFKSTSCVLFSCALNKMILGAISLLDCAVFVVFLIPNLLAQAGLYQTLLLINVLPFLLFRLPYQLLTERYFTKKEGRTPFVRNATFFQDLVIRCVRYAFANMPVSIGRVFFSKWVAYPFLKFRLLRHGYLESPIPYQEVDKKGVKGLWIVSDQRVRPDIVIYYCHGGGFSMGSSYFYLEFLMAWITCLKDRGFRNPAVFALEYTLVPEATWPRQFEETMKGYEFLHDFMGGDAANICVSGDSAGATLILSLLLSLNKQSTLGKPGLAVLVSPWTHLFSSLNKNTPSDYLDREALHLYARQYVGQTPTDDNPENPSSPRDEKQQVFSTSDHLISPGLSTHWQEASPQNGFCIVHGSEEVFTPGIQQMVKNMKRDWVTVKVTNLPSGIHAWPVVNLFLGESRDERLKGLNIMTDYVVSSMK